MKEFPIERAFEFLEPGPVILLSTSDGKKNNLMTMSWHMVVDFVPEFAIVIGPWDYSYKALMKTKECVIAIPPAEIIKKVIEVGNCSGRDTDKFTKFKLTPLKAKKVIAPLVGEAKANIECKVINTDLADKFGIVVLKGVKAWINPKLKNSETFHANGDGTFVIDGKKVNLKKLMTKFKDEYYIKE